VRQILRRWVADNGLDRNGPVAQLDAEEHALVDELFPRLFEWMVNPTRRLPTGQTLAELARADDGDLAGFEDHADRMVGGYCAIIEQDGAVLCSSRPQPPVRWRAGTGGARRAGPIS
jgi:hypothetical protein